MAFKRRPAESRRALRKRYLGHQPLLLTATLVTNSDAVPFSRTNFDADHWFICGYTASGSWLRKAKPARRRPVQRNLTAPAAEWIARWCAYHHDMIDQRGKRHADMRTGEFRKLWCVWMVLRSNGRSCSAEESADEKSSCLSCGLVQ